MNTKPRQEAGELGHILGEWLVCLEAKGGQSAKTGWMGFPRLAQQGLRRAMKAERHVKSVQTTVISYSEAFTQIPRLPVREKISSW